MKQLLRALIFSTSICLSNNSMENNLINISNINPSIIIDLRYAKQDNFTGKIIYNSYAQAYLLRFVAEKLNQVQEYLKKRGLGLKIWDAYRPVSAQWVFWKVFPDERYISNPSKGGEGGRHPRGTTVDVTLVRLSDGKELPMPTGFDDFTQKAHADYNDLPVDVLQNRAILKEAMEKFGFKSIRTEWWHFDIINWKSYPVQDIDFETLAKTIVN